MEIMASFRKYVDTGAYADYAMVVLNAVVFIASKGLNYNGKFCVCLS